MCKEDLLLEFRDWAYLLLEVLELISTKVKSITDYVRFRAVCSSWRAVSHPKPRHLPPQLPWLMLPYNPGEMDDGIRLFYDFWEGKTHEIYLPESSGMMCCASCHGWLFLVETEGREVILLNPLTRAQIQLPPFTTPAQRLGHDPDNNPFNLLDILDWYPYKKFIKSKMTFSADPTDPNCLITVFFWRCWVICCRVRDPYWTWVTHDTPHMLQDVTYYNGRFYLLFVGEMEIINPNKPKERIIISFSEPVSECFSVYFVEGKSGVYFVASPPPKRNNRVLYQFEEQSLKVKVIGTCNKTISFCHYNMYGYFDRPIVDLFYEDQDSLVRDSIYVEYNCSYVSNGRGLGSHFAISCVEPNGRVIKHPVCDPDKKWRLLKCKHAHMWLQPSCS